MSETADDLSPADELELLRRREAEHRRRLNEEMNRLIRAEHRRAKGDADLWPSREAIEAKRSDLEAAGLPAGYRALAAALHSSPTTIRRRLGKTK